MENEDFSEILEYLPIEYNTPQEEEYIVFLLNSVASNYDSGNYHFSLFSLHMIFMFYAQSQVFNIKENRRDCFTKALTALSKDSEKCLTGSSHFGFSDFGESALFRFFKLIGANNSDVGGLADFVKRRNEMAHANGNIYYSDEESAEKRVIEYKKGFSRIFELCRELYAEIFGKIISEFDYSLFEDSDEASRKEDVRNYIIVYFIIPCFVSKNCLVDLLDFDIDSLKDSAVFPGIKVFFEIFKKLVKEEFC